jgi:hypothetical protein
MRRTRGLWLLLATVIGAIPLAADAIGSHGETGLESFSDGLDDLPPAQIGGWFFNSYPFYSDPSRIWTSAGNIATMNYWASLVAQLGEHPELLAQLYGLGLTDLPGTEWINQSQTTLTTQTNTQLAPAVVPEPATLEILGFALGIFGLYVGTHARQNSPWFLARGRDRIYKSRCHATKV